MRIVRKPTFREPPLEKTLRSRKDSGINDVTIAIREHGLAGATPRLKLPSAP